jgi:hypothetical protein
MENVFWRCIGILASEKNKRPHGGRRNRQRSCAEDEIQKRWSNADAEATTLILI